MPAMGRSTSSFRSGPNSTPKQSRPDSSGLIQQFGAGAGLDVFMNKPSQRPRRSHAIQR
jgi:hypothetical protein